MKTRSQCHGRLAGGVRLAGICLLLLLAGCISQRVVWSPDGQRAAVLASEGLHFTDAEGHLSGLLVPRVTTVAWFPDSRRLALARAVRCTNWTQLSSTLRAEPLERLRNQGLAARARLQANQAEAVLQELNSDQEKNAFAAALLFLKHEHPSVNIAPLQSGVPSTVDVSTLAVAEIDDKKVRMGPLLSTELGSIGDIRVSPNSVAIAFTVDSGDVAPLVVVTTNAGAAPHEVALRAARHPDWAADGNTLWYIVPASAHPGESLEVGMLMRRTILNAQGQVELRKADELAGLLFNGLGRVRCLRDGRVLFAAEELQLPVTERDVPQRQQLYALDPDRQATLSRLVPRAEQETLPENLGYFEVSPDHERVAILGDENQVAVFTISSGEVTNVQPDTSKNSKSIPSWRSATELCYVTVEGTGTNAHCQIALWQAGKTNVISRNWPEVIREGWLD